MNYLVVSFKQACVIQILKILFPFFRFEFNQRKFVTIEEWPRKNFQILAWVISIFRETQIILLGMKMSSLQSQVKYIVSVPFF